MDRPRSNLEAGTPSGAQGIEHLPPSPWAITDVEPPAMVDRLIHAAMGRYTGSISPASLALAYTDWALHFAQSPGKWQRLAEKSVRKAARFAIYAARANADPDCEPCIEPLPQDRRFRSEAWRRWPFNLIYQGFLLNQQWWHNVTTGIGGVSPHHEQVVSFVARQILDTVSPLNFIMTNPEVLSATTQELGMNLVRGAANFAEDVERALAGKPPVGAENFIPGQHVAVTPGQVVFRNRLIELIQYAPATPQVHAEPMLIVPAWIMKYYILDLSPHNSLVKYLVERGHTVFMISWHNPTVHDRDLDMDDYLRMGILDSLHAIQTIVPDQKINVAGYCLGGTLLAMAAAYLAQVKDARLNSMTLLAAQTDFSEAGELTLFIDDSQLNFLEDVMWNQGFLDNRQMAGAFQLLRSHDLIWSLIVQQYLMGGQQTLTDLMAWNADATRMPFRMHSEYLHRLFLKNDFAAGRFKVNGKSIALGDIRTPIFTVATETDHVAPWRSVYKIHLASAPEITFLLTSGGHNAGIVSEPGHRKRHYRMAHRPSGTPFVDPESWYMATPPAEGSWWGAWAQWLEQHASGKTAPPSMGAPKKGYPPLGRAPGNYVLER